jgi:hypothetical protein
LIFDAADEIRLIRYRAESQIQSVHRNLARAFEEEGMTRDEAFYEIYKLGARIEADALEA